jgi:hypothetical protein
MKKEVIVKGNRNRNRGTKSERDRDCERKPWNKMKGIETKETGPSEIELNVEGIRFDVRK